MKKFSKAFFWFALACFIVFCIGDLMSNRFSFTLPYNIAVKIVGPAPMPTQQELEELHYPAQEPGRDYSSSIAGHTNQVVLALRQSAFMAGYQEKWLEEVESLESTLRNSVRGVLSVLLIGVLWKLYKSLGLWWSRSVRPSAQSALRAGLPLDALSAGNTIPEMVGDGLKQRQLKKHHEEFKRLESLLQSGLITQSQFDEKKALIAGKVQKSL